MSVQILHLLPSVLTLGLVCLLLGTCTAVLHVWVSRQPESDSLIDRVNELLPQIQCAQCGFPGCRPYASAIANGERLDLCPPGGETTARRLAEFLDRPVQLPVDPTTLDAVAQIDESQCVGCALCIQACPVDAIVGADRYMHTVIKKHCTGCELCVPVCPVDCIDLVATHAHA